MAPRPEPKDVLADFCENVYIEPPTDVAMVYPAILCVPQDYDVIHADNKPHSVTKQYLVTYIDEEVDSPVPDQLILLPRCRFGRHYVAENLHHFTFSVYL